MLFHSEMFVRRVHYILVVLRLIMQCCQVGRNWRRLVGIPTFSAPESDKWSDFLQKVGFPTNKGHWSIHGLATHLRSQERNECRLFGLLVPP